MRLHVAIYNFRPVALVFAEFKAEMIVWFLLTLFTLQCAGNFDPSEVPANIYGFQAKDINGQMVDFSEFRGKVGRTVSVIMCLYLVGHFETNFLEELFSNYGDSAYFAKVLLKGTAAYLVAAINRPKKRPQIYFPSLHNETGCVQVVRMGQ